MCEPAFANTWSGRFSVIDSGSIAGPSYTQTSTGFNILASRTTTAAGPANIGLAFTFDPCADASTFTGVSFSITGQVTGCSVLFQVDDSERSAGGNGGPAITVSSVSATAQTVRLPWSTTGGQPPGPVDASHVAILIWGFSIPASTNCMANVNIGDLTLY
jgi:hypothetical protein